MIIDEKKYILPTDNYVSNETQKKIIVIGHTGNRDMKHVAGWLHRYNKKFKRTAAFTIDAAGSVYKHFDPKFHSCFFNDPELDVKTIVILLENEGWLIKDIIKNEYSTLFGGIYKQSNEIVCKNWRGHSLWVPYTKQQMESAKDLVKSLFSSSFV